MIRFKVIRASHLLLAVAIILLVAALALVGARLLNRSPSAPSGTTANLVQANENEEAKTTQVFASSDKTGPAVRPAGSGDIQIEVVRQDPDTATAQRILIYHTHTHEAYEQMPDDPYPALEAWRTADAGHSVVRVGEELAACLRRYGFEVTHNITDHEADQLSTAYTRSLETLLGYPERFDLYIDLHRDAYCDGEPLAVTSPQGEALAPIMLLVGNGKGFGTPIWYEQNHAFASALEERINAVVPGLCKPVLVKNGRYNQHIGVFSVLVEVGHNRNTLVQAINAVQPLAAAIHSLLVDDPERALITMKSKWEAEHPFHAADATTDGNDNTPLMLDSDQH